MDIQRSRDLAQAIGRERRSTRKRAKEGWPSNPREIGNLAHW